MRKQILIAAVSMLIFFQPAYAEQASQEVVGKVSEVIVYRGQALVCRKIEVKPPNDNLELVVRNLPEKIIPESLYAQASDDATVTSVRYRKKEVEEDTREEVKQLEADIEKAELQLRHAQANRKIIQRHMDTITQLQNFTITAQGHDLNRGLLKFEPLENFVSLAETKRNEYHNSTLKLEDEVIELNKELGLLRKKLQKLQAGRSRIEREAVLVIKNPGNKKADIYLKYLVRDASWLPQYNLRANQSPSKVSIEYNAIIHQASGEDWENVVLSLSTAQPAMAAGAPILEPIKVDLSKVGGGYWGRLRARKAAKEQKENLFEYDKSAYRDLSQEFNRLQSQRQEMGRKGVAAQSTLSKVALDNQMMELQADKAALKVMKKEARRFARTEGVSVTYELGGGLTMPSRSDQQLVTIAAFEAKADFLMIGTPLMTDYVYLQADIINDSDVILLAGPASMYRDVEFVGKGRIEMVTIGEKFTAGFGVDSQVKISREFKDKKVDTLWGNRVEKYDYRIAIDNYKNIPVKLRLLERIPYTENEELEITGFETNVSLSTDKEYLRTEKDKGILRWDLTLKPATVEEKATIVTYSYSMKYDNDMHIHSLPGR